MKNLILFFFTFLAVSASAQSGAKATRSLFDNKTIGEIRIKVAGKNWSDVLDSMRIYGGGMLNASATIDGALYEGVGIRFRGDKSYVTGLKRNPFLIKLNMTNPEQNHQGYAALKLSAAVRDPSMVREVLFHEIAAKYMPSSKACYTKLYVNDEYIGVFINVESVEKQMLEANYGTGKGAFFKAGVDYKSDNTPSGCKLNIFGSMEHEDNIECYKNNFEMNSTSGWSELQELTRLLSQGAKEVEKVLDIDRTLWMLALNDVMVNLNSYSGNHSVNYYIFRDGNGKFQPIHWDLNLAFGSYKNTGLGSDLDLKGLQSLDPLLHSDNPYKPLISQLLKDPFYKKIYLAHIRQINEENFLNGSYEKRAQELQGMIVVPFNDDKYKTYSLDDFTQSLKGTVGKRSKIPGIVELMAKRAKYLKNHPELTSLPSAVSDVKVMGRGKFENQALNAFHISAKADRFPKRMVLCYRFQHNEPYMMLSMSEENTAGMPSGVKAFSAMVEAKTKDAELEYYIIAENAGTVGFAPATYTKEGYKIKLSDLNK
ncbi:MAG: CotH kinase family protein [Saprospiraceae bacterium]|nr:CotH kinase family protein [Saprospiraceae bacterium]